MGPHIRLESVMRLRRSEQRQHEFLLQKENAIVDRLLRKVVEFDREILRISNAPPHARTGAEIEFDHERVRILAAEQKELQGELQSARERQEIAAAALHGAWQKRETLEILQRHEHEALAKEQNTQATAPPGRPISAGKIYPIIFDSIIFAQLLPAKTADRQNFWGHPALGRMRVCFTCNNSPRFSFGPALEAKLHLFVSTPC
jgi:hypothetical protein